MKKYIFSMVSGLIALICFVTYNIMGSEILPDGRIVEHFGLIAIGFLFIFIGVISTIIVALAPSIRNLLKKKK